MFKRNQTRVIQTGKKPPLNLTVHTKFEELK